MLKLFQHLDISKNIQPQILVKNQNKAEIITSNCDITKFIEKYLLENLKNSTEHHFIILDALLGIGTREEKSFFIFVAICR